MTSQCTTKEINKTTMKSNKPNAWNIWISYSKKLSSWSTIRKPLKKNWL